MPPKCIPVVDLFAGPGGLGEGFATYGPVDQRAFRVVLSIEKDAAAHKTLELRSFFRQFAPSAVPDAYYGHLQGQLSREDLFGLYPQPAAAARMEAWEVELGKVSSEEVDAKIRACLAKESTWVLCGGPPCQAYSLIGRSRNGGIDAKDHRVYLYREYLRILAEHRPSLFIFENVKGLLSSKLGNEGIIHDILRDLSDPHSAVGSGQPGRYRLYSLVVPPRSRSVDGSPTFDHRDFTIKCEEYGIPQSRHRVIILGISEGLALESVHRLRSIEPQISAEQVLCGLPRLRSGLSRTDDSKDAWRAALLSILSARHLDGIPNGKGAALRDDIRWTLNHLTLPRADRGAEFIPGKTTIEYRPDWFCDPRLGGVCNHASRPHIKEDLYRYLFAASYARLHGKSPELRDFPPNLLPKHKNVLEAKKLLYFDDRFRVQLTHKPATTITSHIAKDGHYYIHYDQTQCRSLTVREAARLQTFPDNYFFCGTRTQQYVQVGNAVPPLLALQIAEIVQHILLGNADAAHAEGAC